MIKTKAHAFWPSDLWIASQLCHHKGADTKLVSYEPLLHVAIIMAEPKSDIVSGLTTIQNFQRHDMKYNGWCNEVGISQITNCLQAESNSLKLFGIITPSSTLKSQLPVMVFMIALLGYVTTCYKKLRK